MWPFSKDGAKKREEKREEKRRLDAKNQEFSNAMDLYESLIDLYSKMIGFFLVKCDSREKLIETWNMFFSGISLVELVHVASLAGYTGDAERMIRESAMNGKYVVARVNTDAVEVFYLNMKALVEIFFGLLGGSERLNVLCDYLEENLLIDEDGAVRYRFYKGGEPMTIHIPSHLYERVEYDPETGSAKEGT